MEAIRIKAKKELARIMELPINKETLLYAYEKGYKRATRDMNDAHKQTPIEFEDCLWTLSMDKNTPSEARRDTVT